MTGDVSVVRAFGRMLRRIAERRRRRSNTELHEALKYAALISDALALELEDDDEFACEAPTQPSFTPTRIGVVTPKGQP